MGREGRGQGVSPEWIGAVGILKRGGWRSLLVDLAPPRTHHRLCALPSDVQEWSMRPP